MSAMWLILGVSVGLAIGGLLIWLITRVRSTATRVELQTKLDATEEKLTEFRRAQEETRQQLSDTFKSLAAEALQSNNVAFLDSAKRVLETNLVQAQGDLELRKQAVEQLVKPLGEALKDIERHRESAYGSIKQLVETMAQGQQILAQETRTLAQALRTPHGAGRWGELTLRRVAELAGMVRHCDFDLQETIEGEDSLGRPDMIVNLPNERRIAVDAKAPLDAYLRAIEAGTEEIKNQALKEHAEHLANRVRQLARKSYWASLGYTPEFVVLFLPGEPLLAAALEKEPGLLEKAMADRIVLATPSTLIALLLAVAWGWSQEQMTKNAQTMYDLGRDLHDRIAIWAGHLKKIRDSLENAVSAFNGGIGSLERRVLVSTRQFKELGVISDQGVPVIDPVDTPLRQLPAGMQELAREQPATNDGPQKNGGRL